LNDGRAAESQTDSQAGRNGVNGIGIDATCQRLGSLAELAMNPAQTVFVKKYTGSVLLMIQPPRIIAMTHNQWTIGRNAIR
jgi:hypothetical protein